MGGGGFGSEPDNPLLEDHILELARTARGRERPRVCFVARASGDADGSLAGFYVAFARCAEATHLAPRPWSSAIATWSRSSAPGWPPEASGSSAARPLT